jgi:hypothetical protein
VTPGEALTDAERAAARVFLDDRVAVFRALPEVTWQPPVYVHHIRHLCSALAKSISFELKEVCQDSPRYAACGCGSASTSGSLDGVHSLLLPDCSGAVTVQAGRFTWIYREGRCPDCKMTARSANGRLADATLRPPLGRS